MSDTGDTGGFFSRIGEGIRSITGQTLTAARASLDINSPEVVAARKNVFQGQQGQILEFPSGLTATIKAQGSKSIESGPYMRITAFEYERGIAGSRDLGNKLFSIYLPTPGNLAQSYVANWQQFDAGLVGAAADKAGGSGADAAAAAFSGGVGLAAAPMIAGAAAEKLLSKFANKEKIMEALKAGATDQNVRNVASNAVGTTMNPRQEMTFNGSKVRTHAFSFLLIPTKEAESFAARAIIRNLKLAMHANYQGLQRVALTYPAEFIIEFFNSDGSPMLDVPSIPDSVLTGFTFVINPGMPTARTHFDNTPVAYQIQMQFSETNAVTRDDLQFLDKLSFDNQNNNIGTSNRSIIGAPPQ